MSDHDRTLQTSRWLPFAPAAVYAAFQDGQALARWWGPEGFRNTFEVFEFRPGGLWRFVMHGPDGRDYPNESRFEALEPGARVCLRHVCAPHFTLDVRLQADGAGTRVHWAQTFDDPATARAVAAYAGPGNEQNLDRLTRVLAG